MMKNLMWLGGGATLFLASCESIVGGASYSAGLSSEVRGIAAPYQDLSDVRIDPNDGCYVYRYTGPVETTYLPLRTVQGNPICTRLPDAGVEESAT